VGVVFRGVKASAPSVYSTQGLKPIKIPATFLARPKPSPDTKLLLPRFEYETIWEYETAL
jgi:hypothetical protein